MSSKTDRELQAIKDLAIAYREALKRQPGSIFHISDLILQGRAYLISQGYSPEETEQALAYMFQIS